MAPSSHRAESTVGVVGDPSDGVASTVSDAVGRVVDGDAPDVLDADPAWIVAVGEASLISLVRAGVDRPVLPVGAGGGVPSVRREDAAGAVDAVLSGDAETVERGLVAVRVDDATVNALFDVMLVTAEPARISEYTVSTGDRRVARFRADGVVVATPAGSNGYANAVGGPVVEPGTNVGAVVPVSPFVTDADHWVLDLADITLDVERESSVSLIVDDRKWRTVAPGESVHLASDGHVTMYRVPSSLGIASAGWEKL